MKFIALTSALLMLATTSYAGSYGTNTENVAPVAPIGIAPDQPAPVPGGSVGGWLVPIVALGLIAVYISASSADNKDK